MTNCNVRFMDNQKVEAGNYTVTNEDANFLFSNAIDNIRSKVFRSTSNSAWRLTIDLGFADKVNVLTLFPPLGESLGITREATIKLQADNVSVWTSPELSIDLTLTSDDKLVYFLDDTLDLNYRFWSLYIDDPANPNAYIEFAYVYLGDYTTTTLRNIDRGFSWVTVDPSTVKKSIDGTPYFESKTKYDTLGGIRYALVTEADRLILEQLYERLGRTSWLPISLDPENQVGSSNINDLTKLARIAGNFSRAHRVFEYFDISIDLEEII